MAISFSPEQLTKLFNATSPFALIDVREPGEYNTSHIPGSSLIPRRRLEFDLHDAVPHAGTLIVLCDDDGRRVSRAVTTVEAMGFSHVGWLDGGINRWVSLDYPTEWGVNVPSKDFGEKVEVVHHVPEIDAIELRSRMDRGEKMVILDTRTPEEYRRFCIPGGRSVPGGELALRITDITADLDPDTTVVVNCAGRTRSIIGTRVLQRMGLDREVVGLKNGTSGWVLAGYELESGATRDRLPGVSEEAGPLRKPTPTAAPQKMACASWMSPVSTRWLTAASPRASTSLTCARPRNTTAAAFRVSVGSPVDSVSNAATTSPL